MKRKRNRYADKYNAGPSRAVPLIPGEAAMDRHYRRKISAMADERRARLALAAVGIEMSISNNGHHWRMFRSDLMAPGFFAEWWPSSAKLVINSRWRDGIHVHDVDRMVEIVLAHANPNAGPRADKENAP